MNPRLLKELGVPKHCHKLAIQGVQQSAKAAKGSGSKRNFKKLIPSIVANPDGFVDDEFFGEFAKALIEDREFVMPDPIDYKVWGDEFIDQGSREQIGRFCTIPDAVGAALMPDAHVGYGLPIGGVGALENKVSPYAVGVDICCSMHISVLDIDVPEKPLWDERKFDDALWQGTRFGMGCKFDRKNKHDVMDADWNVTKITKQRKDVAWEQLGTSGGGNHFVEFGLLTIGLDNELNIPAGKYVALMSHSGSRGAGLNVCNWYSDIAQGQTPSRFNDLKRNHLTWLDLDSEAGQEYWLAMQLMGEYAKANHEVIHDNLSKLVGADVLAHVYNSHNFAWEEEHNGQKMIVHRKGATPAHKGQLGVIPGSMATPAYVVVGKGNEDSMCSASHGAGRCMSRKQAKDKFNFKAVQKDLETKGVRVLQAGADEVPGVYKNIGDVMSAQTDLVDIVAQFNPKVVMMAGADREKPWQKKKRKKAGLGDADW